MTPGTEDEILHHVLSLYDRGRFLDAYTELGRLGSPEALPPGRVSIVGARLVRHLGAPTRAQRLVLAAYRHRPRDPWTRIAAEAIRIELRGAWATRESLERVPIGEDADRAAQCDALELTAMTGLFYRDFAVVEAALERWAKLDAADPDLAFVRACWLERTNRLPESLELAQSALAEHPLHRRLRLETSQLLALSGRAEDALALVRDALDTMQSSDMARLTYALAMSLRAHRDALRAVERLAELTPLAEPETADEIRHMRAEAHFRLGETDEARAIAQESSSPAMIHMIERIGRFQAAETVRRLDVPFVRQHHLTCAPATLAALCAFFQRPAEHVEVADRICYAGTPAHAERAWAEAHGFVVREFTLTWESARALLDRDLPFEVSTFVPGSGHAQAVMGYDARDRTLVLRDPTIPLPLHVDADEFLEQYRHSGPRAMVLVPSDDAQHLQNRQDLQNRQGLQNRQNLQDRQDLPECPLPDAALYDELHVLERALSNHDRETALASCARMRSAAPGHRLARAAHRAIASYDGNVADLLARAEETLALDPTNHLARLDTVAGSGALEARDARIRRLTEAAEACPAAHAFRLRLAGELVEDAREHGRARRILRKILTEHAESADALWLLGRIAWSEGKTECAVARWRLAACVDLTNDGRVRHYVGAARRMGRTDEALQVIRERVALFGARSAEPAVLLADILDEAGDPGTALQVLEEAEKRRPDDGEPPLAAARYNAARGRGDEARAALERARGKTDRASWLRSAALASAGIGMPAEEQIALWSELATLAPLDVQAHHNVAVLLRRTRGREDAVAHLRAHIARFPHHVPTARLQIEWLRDSDPAAREQAIRRCLAAEPNDAWAHRELALTLANRQRWGEARNALARAASLEPHSPSLELVRASIADRMGHHEEARVAYRAGLELHADSPSALYRLVLLEPEGGREAVIRDLFRRIERGAIEQDTFEALYGAAKPHLAHETLAELLDALRERRPEMPTIWALSIRHALAAPKANDHVPANVSANARAQELAERALVLFPFADDIHLETAYVWLAAGDAERQMAALEGAVELGPKNVAAMIRWTQALEARGDHEKVDAVLDRACHRSSFDPVVALHAARLRAHRSDTAALELARVLDRDPECDAAWDAVHEFASFSEDAGRRIREKVHQIAQEHPQNERAQISHATFLAFNGEPDAASALLAATLERMPDSLLLRDESARIFAAVGRFPDALRACEPRENESGAPAALRARAAWVHLVAGDPARGIKELHEVLRDDASITAAWRWLVDALFEQRAQQRALEAAQKLAAIAPFEAGTQDRLGRALLGVGDRRGGKNALRRAVEQNRANVSIALTLFYIGIEDGDLDTAAFALRALRAQIPEEQLVPHEIRAAIAHDKGADAVHRFRKACVDHRVAHATLECAYRWMIFLGLGARANDAVEEALAEGAKASAAAGTLWMRIQARRHGLGISERLPSIPASSAAGRSVAVAFCDLLAQSTRYIAVSQLRARADWLRSDDVCWSAAIGPWVAHGLHRDALAWSRDWRERKHASPVRLHDLVLALRAVGFRKRAITVSRMALAAGDAGPLTGHRAWLAFEEAIARRTTEASAHLARIEVDEREEVGAEAYPPVARQVAHVARTLVEVQNSAPPHRQRAIGLARQAIASLVADPQMDAFTSDIAWRARFHLLWRGQLGALFYGQTLRIPSFKLAWIAPMLVIVLHLGKVTPEDTPVLAVLFGIAVVLLASYAAFRAFLARL